MQVSLTNAFIERHKMIPPIKPNNNITIPISKNPPVLFLFLVPVESGIFQFLHIPPVPAKCLPLLVLSYTTFLLCITIVPQHVLKKERFSECPMASSMESNRECIPIQGILIS